MPFWVQYLLFGIGLVLIIKGGDFFVDAASWIAEVSGIPKFIIGATIVSVATTLPELIVSLIAAAGGKVDMAVGNAVGSVTANTGLILAISLFFTTVVIKRRDYIVNAVLLALSAAILLISGQGGSFAIWGSVVLMGIFAVFITENVISAKREMDGGDEREKIEKKTLIINAVKFVTGTAGIVLGSQLLVDSGSEIALKWGISEALISVTLVAIGTSLPELVTTVTSVIKKQGSLSLGNILGANIIDLTLIMPLCSLVSGKALPLSTQALSLDLPFCLGVILLALVPLLIRQKTGKVQALGVFAVYCTYLVLLVR